VNNNKDSRDGVQVISLYHQAIEASGLLDTFVTSSYYDPDGGFARLASGSTIRTNSIPGNLGINFVLISIDAANCTGGRTDGGFDYPMTVDSKPAKLGRIIALSGYLSNR
jgi:hypothetical protein